MKKIILLMGILSLFGCGNKNLTTTETELINSLKFDLDLMKVLKLKTNSELLQLPTIDKETSEILNGQFKGIHAKVSEKKGKKIVSSLKDKFKKSGYLIFLYSGVGYDDYSVAVLKGGNELDILRYRRTNAINYDLDGDDVIAKISNWNDKYGVLVLGSGMDWLEVKFKKMPDDIDSFANEVYEFCPDSVDQGVESVENLALLINELKGVWLWWD